MRRTVANRPLYLKHAQKPKRRPSGRRLSENGGRYRTRTCDFYRVKIGRPIPGNPCENCISLPFNHFRQRAKCAERDQMHQSGAEIDRGTPGGGYLMAPHSVANWHRLTRWLRAIERVEDVLQVA